MVADDDFTRLGSGQCLGMIHCHFPRLNVTWLNDIAVQNSAHSLAPAADQSGFTRAARNADDRRHSRGRSGRA